MTKEQESDLVTQNLAKVGLLNMHNSGGRTKPPQWVRDGPGHTPEFTTLKKIGSSIKNIAFNKGRANQGSPYADSDSGYQSGGTPSIRFRDSLVSQVESPAELDRPYRITCYAIHEPKFPDEYRETQPCTACRYSNTHNLASIGNYLRLQQFKEELRLDFYKIKDIDAAGNSALHYAAAFGASYAHLNALIDAGVPPYQLNTANQNFLHCLRPCNAGLDGWDLDSSKFNLTTLLNRLEKFIFGQQDNDGQTVLHALASHVTEPELREQIFKYVISCNVIFP
jgi:hypothetical protein